MSTARERLATTFLLGTVSHEIWGIVLHLCLFDFDKLPIVAFTSKADLPVMTILLRYDAFRMILT